MLFSIDRFTFLAFIFYLSSTINLILFIVNVSSSNILLYLCYLIFFFFEKVGTLILMICKENKMLSCSDLFQFGFIYVFFVKCELTSRYFEYYIFIKNHYFLIISTLSLFYFGILDDFNSKWYFVLSYYLNYFL